MSDPRTDLPSPSAPNFQQRIRETLQTYLGRQGNPLDRGLTLRDLIENGILKLRDGFSLRPGAGSLPLDFGPRLDGEPDLTPPPTPTGFTVGAAISHVFIEHDDPVYTQGHGHLRTRVYGVQVATGDPLPTFADAAELTQFSGTVHAMPSNPATTWRLWIKWETKDGVLSVTPAGGTNGLEAITGQDPGKLLQVLTGQIKESQLFSSLGDRIDLIDGPATLAGSVAARIQSEATTRSTEDGKLFAQYTVKIDTNGYVSGFGLASTLNNAVPTSEFLIRADKFAVASPSGPGITPIVPFVVNTTATTVNGVNIPAGVYMDGAYIVNLTAGIARLGIAWIDDAKIASVSAAKLTAGTVNVGVEIKSSDFNAVSKQGWRINSSGTSSGTAEFYNVIAYGTVYASAGEIGGNSITSTAVQSPFWGTGGYGWRLGSDGIVKMVSSGGSRIFDLGASGSQPVLKIGDVLTVLANGTASFGGSVTATEVKGGFTSWDWPASGGGYYLGPNGLRLGRYDSGAYLDMRSNGDLYAPAFDIVAGVMTLKQANVVESINLASNAVNVTNSASGTGTAANEYSISTSLNIPAGKTWKIVCHVQVDPGVAYTWPITLNGSTIGYIVPVSTGSTGDGVETYGGSGFQSIEILTVTGPQTFTITLSTGVSDANKKIVVHGGPQ